MNFNQAVNREKLTEFELFITELNKRGLAELTGTSYEPLNPRLANEVMYYQPLLCAPSSQRETAVNIICTGNEALLKSPRNKACNLFPTFMYGPSEIYNTLSGRYNPVDAFVDFELAQHDQDYVHHIGENIAWARAHGFKLWTNTELHTSLQTEARNFCRIKYNEPTRPASPTDLIDWIASWITNGTIDRLLEAKTLPDAYDVMLSIRGVGPYYAGNPAIMVASMHETAYSHEEPFCAPGKGAIVSLDWLFDGAKVNTVAGIKWLWESQEVLMPTLTIPLELQNLASATRVLWDKPQTRFSMSSFEIALCQFSVYLRFATRPDLIEKRKNTPLDLTKFKQRDDIVTGKAKSLLEF